MSGAPLTRPASWSAVVTLAFAMFVVSLVLRAESFGNSTIDGRPMFPPLDDLYHAKRIAYSAAHFPHVLESDPDKGFGGSGTYGHWPPLWDLSAAAVARLVGRSGESEVLAVAAWLPPLITSLATALVAGALAARAGVAAGLFAGAAIVFSPSLLDVSRYANIDHHFLEPFLLLGITAAVIHLRARGSVVTRGLVLASALATALFVQTTMLFAAAAATGIILVLLSDERETLVAASIGFSAAAAVVAAYRVTRPADYPAYEYYLGWPHVSALFGAAAACIGTWAALTRGRSRAMAVVFGLLGGTAVASLFPSAFARYLDGLLLFNDPWIRQIEECRPIFAADENPLGNFASLLGGGALLLVPFAFDSFRSGRRNRQVLAAMALSYTGAALSSRRFSDSLVAVLAVAGALVAAELLQSGRAVLGSVAAVVLLAPSVVVALPSITSPPGTVPARAAPMIRTAQFLRSRKDRGRVLGPFSWGHLFDVVGRHPVVIDNFGWAGGRALFEDAQRIFLSTGEEKMAAYCRAAGVKWVVLENPFESLTVHVESLGQPVDPFFRPPSRPGAGWTFTRLSQATFWWRAYYDEGRDRPEAGRWGHPFRSFRLAYRDPQRAWAPAPYDGPASVVWEFTPDS